jgi:predicted ferric reductase
MNKPLRRPIPSRLLDIDVVAITAVATMVVMGVWLRHGGVDMLVGSSLDRWSSISRVSGLFASFTGLVGIALSIRSTHVERKFGLDTMYNWHRILGETMAIALVVHIWSGVMSWSVGSSVLSAIRDLTGREPYMAMATVGAVFIFIVAFTSLRAIRRRMSYETWYFMHLLSYAGFALAFSHTIVLGGDFNEDSTARSMWIGIHVAIVVWLVIGRWGRLLRSILRPLRITNLESTGVNTVVVTLSGSALEFIRGDAGQFCYLRPLVRRAWWKSNPYSMSAAPSTDGLRFTIKDRGDASQLLGSLPLGTRVAVEGPYGTCTPEILAGNKLLMIAGGVGIGPIRSLLERVGPETQPVILYRARSEKDLVHVGELNELAVRVNGQVRTLVGPTSTLAGKDPFSKDFLLDLVPDLHEREAVVAGPESLLFAAYNGLRAAGIHPLDIHFERPWW